MSLIDKSSPECLKSELEIFDVPPTQASIEKSKIHKIYTTNSVDKYGPLEFKIRLPREEYWDPSSVVLYTKNRILDQNGQELTTQTNANGDIIIPDDSVVFPINYFHATRFKNVEVFINSKLVSNSENLYPYRAFLETLLTYGTDAKNEQLRCGMFYIDSPPLGEHQQPQVSANRGAYKRFQNSLASQTFECLGKIHSELFNQNKLLAGEIEIRIKFHRADPNFCLMAKKGNRRYQVVIDQAILFSRQCLIAPGVREAHQIALLKKNAKYPVKMVQMKYFTFSQGRRILSEPNLTMGVYPQKIILGLLSSSAFSGHLNKNPLQFRTFNTTNIVLKKGSDTVPYEDLQMDYSEDVFMQGYMSLLQSTGHIFRDHGLGISPHEHYPYGYTLYGFDLSADMSNSCSMNLVQEGTVSVEVTLAAAGSESITLMCYLEYDGVIEIGKDGLVQVPKF